MNLLLVGFSDKNAEAVKMFCSRSFKNIQAESIPRQFSDKLTLVLPSNNQLQLQADAFIVYLEGVGLGEYSAESQKELLAFTNAKPTVLVSRRDLSRWRAIEKFVHSIFLYLCAPYSKNDMSEVLEKILKTAPKSDHIQEKNNIDNFKFRSNVEIKRKLENNSQIKKEYFEGKIEKEKSLNIGNYQSKQKLNNIKPTISNQKKSDILDMVVKQYFPTIYDTVFVHSILSLTKYTQPISLKISKYELLINPDERSILMNGDIPRVVDCFCIIGNQKYSVSSGIKIKPLSSSEYLQKSKQFIRGGYKKYALNTILWQIASEVIHQELPNKPQPLRLKVKFIPNFAMMRFVPSYMHSVLSACLSKPRTSAELQSLFPDLSLQQVNHMTLLCILSGVADEVHLLPELKNPNLENGDNVTLSTDKVARNRGIRQANSTGFFQRLLKKLSI